MAVSSSPFSLFSRVFPLHQIPTNFTSKPYLPFLFPPPPRSSLVALARRNRSSSSTPKTEPLSKSKKTLHKEKGEKVDIEDDALEALFTQLEEDLKNDNISDYDSDEEISEEDLAKLEQELEEAFSELPEGLPLTSDDIDDDEESDEEEDLPKLRGWQVKRLARALKIGRRKTSMKSLAAELGLDRAFVLQILRDPPPSLLIMSASLPDEVKQTPQPETRPVESPPESTPITNASITESKPKVNEPVHVLQSRWLMQKRLKKVHVETLERVYSRTKRPTNAMINSIIDVTNLPFKKVVKWFEDKRLEDGIPDPAPRVPFRRSLDDAISTS